MINLNTDKGAIFSANKKYRYLLWRCWNPELPKVLFIGLNPSTANATDNDATTRRIDSLSKQLGFGGFVLGNCFPYIATNPKDLKIVAHQLKINDNWLIKVRPMVTQMCFCMG